MISPVHQCCILNLVEAKVLWCFLPLPVELGINMCSDSRDNELLFSTYQFIHYFFSTNRSLIPEFAFDSKTLHSIHICEAPGAFVCSLNHYLKTQRDRESVIWKWLATSLNPHYEGNTIDRTIVDDRLILQTPDCWYFGEDNTGDIMSLENLRGLEKLVETDMDGTVHLVCTPNKIHT